MEAHTISGGRMPPRLDKKSPTERVQIVAPASLLDRIDEWRSKERPIPSRSEVFRIAAEEFVARRSKERDE